MIHRLVYWRIGDTRYVLSHIKWEDMRYILEQWSEAEGIPGYYAIDPVGEVHWHPPCRDGGIEVTVLTQGSPR